MTHSALIIVDVQNDFCPGGALAVKGGDEIISTINRIAPSFSKVIATQDWHPKNHLSFAENHEKALPYEVISLNGISQTLWPPHCVQGSFGAEFHRDLDLNPVNLILRKGIHPNMDSYSAFLENDRKTETGLHYYLKGLKITSLFFCGLATDYCVFYSALDALHFGFSATVILDACKGVDYPQGNVSQSLAILKQKGVQIIEHKDLSF